MRHASQESESIELAVLLALSGGLMDCYSYRQYDKSEAQPSKYRFL